MPSCSAARRSSLLLAGVALACTEPPPKTALEKPIPRLVSQLRKSAVVVEVGDRQGKERPLGAGFVVGADGLIATSLHVIGEARPIRIHLEDGSSHPVTAIHARSHQHDLAVLRIDKKGLPALRLAHAPPVQGASVLALGNPRGMTRSIVTGMVSAVREMDGTPMIQLAIPIEPGNSGGPVTDLSGNVHGVVTMKSRLTENLGFAVEVAELRRLLERPTPVPMKDWLTIGALDPKEWTTLFGGRWRQRAGRVVIEGPGESFAGRTLCLHTEPQTERPYVVSVSVRLDDADGAAGLAIASDGGDVHYGFYPSRGRMRFTRFGGAAVTSWEILHDQRTSAYRPGDWNRLEVVRDERSIEAFVNGRLVFRSESKAGLADGRVGLVKFREGGAEFKHFAITTRRAEVAVSSERRSAVRQLVKKGRLDPAAVQKLMLDPNASLAVLGEEARAHDQRAEELRRAAQEVHRLDVRRSLVSELSQPERKIDLFRAALMVAKLDNPDLRIDDYSTDLERMASAILRRIPPITSEQERLEVMNRYLFAESGFHGSRDEYYHRSNSYLNEVMDDREGLPLTLSILYMALGERIGLRLGGIGLPGHFVVQHLPRRGPSRLIDVFDGGKGLSDESAMAIARRYGGKHPGLELSAPMPKGRIIVRMLRNLSEVARRDGDLQGQLAYLDTMIAIEPNLPRARWERAQLRLRSGPHADAQEDLLWLKQHGH